MPSIRSVILKALLFRTNNFNPNRKKDVIASIKKVSAPQINDKMPKGYVRETLTTKNKTRYERLTAKGAVKADKAVLYFHGGGYIAGLMQFYRQLAHPFCAVAGKSELFLLDYSLSPEHVFPTQLNEALDLWNELCTTHGFLPENIVIGGDSAGANLTLAFMLKLRDMKRPMPRAGFCFSAWTDMNGNGDSFEKNYSRDIMFGEPGKKACVEKKDEYLNGSVYSFIGDADRNHPYISPVYGDYTGFPPMFMCAGDHEMLLDDTLRVIKKLEKAGVRVVYDIQPGMFHTYPLYAKFIPEGESTFKKLMIFLNGCFKGEYCQ